MTDHRIVSGKEWLAARKALLARARTYPSSRQDRRGTPRAALGQVEKDYVFEGHSGKDLPGASIFTRDEAGNVFHTYSAYARGLEVLVNAYSWLDLAPKGRNESGTMSWLKLHDEYDSPKSSCCE